jgi:hypothetical protein
MEQARRGAAEHRQWSRIPQPLTAMPLVGSGDGARGRKSRIAIVVVGKTSDVRASGRTSYGSLGGHGGAFIRYLAQFGLAHRDIKMD